MILNRNIIRSKYLGADMRGHVAIFVATFVAANPACQQNGHKLTQMGGRMLISLLAPTG
jgi:hypothetical protein